jgi:two-component system response regulator AtoC
MADILVVDDDQSIATAFQKFLDHEGHACLLASNAEDAVRLVGERGPDLVIMDVRMPGTDGLTALQTIRKLHGSVPVVIMTAHGTSQTSIDAMRAGAFEYVTKPLDLDQLRDVIARVLSVKDTRAQADDLADAGEGPPAVALVGETPVMHEVYKLIGTLAGADVPALVTGERGTGKELVAATIHANSNRHEQPFVTLDCDSLPPDALEAEIFAAGAGTLYLAGVQAVPRALQARLVRALGSQSPPRAGAAGGTLAARIIASTETDLPKAVENGQFSHELFDLLAVITVPLPPLRERREDIPLLVRHLVQRFNVELNRGVKGVDDQVLASFQEHAWPGNVQQLATVVKRAVILARGDVITPADVEGSLRASPLPGRADLESALARSARLALQERLVEMPAGVSSSLFHDIVGLVETSLVKEALAITNGNQVKASELLGVNRATLRKKAAE